MGKPCKNCPFLLEGGILIHRERRKEISEAIQDGFFPCHKTIHGKTKHEAWCNGALAVLDNEYDIENGGPGCGINQAYRMAYRLGLVKAPQGHEIVYASRDEWIEEAENPRPT